MITLQSVYLDSFRPLFGTTTLRLVLVSKHGIFYQTKQFSRQMEKHQTRDVVSNALTCRSTSKQTNELCNIWRLSGG